MAPDTRARMVGAAMGLFQRHGYRATSWRVLTRASGTPWGSVQHHFPGGKEELGVAAIAVAGESVAALVADCLPPGAPPSEGIRRWFAASADLLVASDFAGGCPVAPVVLEMGTESPVLRAACAEAFASWTAIVAASLRDDGLPATRADQLASTVVGTFEGALILARARRDTAPLHDAAATIAEIIERARPGPLLREGPGGR